MSPLRAELFKGRKIYLDGTSTEGAGAGAASGALPQEDSEKPVSAAKRPRMVAIFIVVFK